MPCPQDERLVAYLGGELDAEQIPDLLRHVRECRECQKAAEQLLQLREHLSLAFREARCPAREDILGFVQGTLDAARRAEVEKHIENCLSCIVLVSELEAIGRDEPGLQAMEIESKVKGILKAAFSGMLSAGEKTFDKLWVYADSIRAKTLEAAEAQLTSDAVRSHVAGALGAGAVEPSAVMALTGILTGMGVLGEVVRGEVSTETESLRKTIRQHSKALGAGTGLQRRLCEILPPALRE